MVASKYVARAQDKCESCISHLVAIFFSWVQLWNLTNPDAPAYQPEISVPAKTDSRQPGLQCIATVHPDDGTGNGILVCGYEDGSMVLRDVESFLAPVATLHGAKNAGHKAAIRFIYPADSANMFFSGGFDGQFFIWQLAFPDSADPAAAGVGAAPGAGRGAAFGAVGFGGATGGGFSAPSFGGAGRMID